MKYLRLHSLDPYLNLAIEEYLLDTADDDVIMLWQNEPSVVVGKNQNIRAEVDLAALRPLGVHPVRRITGGGAVYHDSGNINYSYIFNGHGGGMDFLTPSSAIICALGALGVETTLSGRNDLCLKDGRKISGCAQSSRGGRVLHHGTLLYSADLDILSRVLTPSPEKLATKAVKSTRSRVANLNELLPTVSGTEELIEHIESYILNTLHPTVIVPPSCDRVNALRERNCSDEWLYPTRGISASCSYEKRHRYPFGCVTASVTVMAEKICDVIVSGDFFGDGDISELEELIRGKTRAELESSIPDAMVSKYISGMTRKELIALLLD